MISLHLGLLAAAMGMYIATHIYESKRTKRPLMCPRKNQCDKVVTGAFSTTLGVPNDILGIGYYVIMAGFLAVALAIPLLDTEVLRFAIVIGALVGLLFSLYLLYVQAFRLRTWCLWCLASAVVALLLAMATVVWIEHTPFPMVHDFSRVAYTSVIQS